MMLHQAHDCDDAATGLGTTKCLLLNRGGSDARHGRSTTLTVAAASDSNRHQRARGATSTAPPIERPLPDGAIPSCGRSLRAPRQFQPCRRFTSTGQVCWCDAADRATSSAVPATAPPGTGPAARLTEGSRTVELESYRVAERSEPRAPLPGGTPVLLLLGPAGCPAVGLQHLLDDPA